MKNKKGISLIVLVITIIIIIILAGAVILNLADNNPIENASEAKIMQDIDTFKSELTMYVSNAYANNVSLNLKDIQSIDEDGKRVEDIIKSMKNIEVSGVKYSDILKVYNGTLCINKKALDENVENGNISIEEKNIIIEALGVSSEITVAANANEYYGKIVKESETSNDEWQIFHSDGDNIYLIMKDYIKYDRVPETREGVSMTAGATEYIAIFNEAMYTEYKNCSGIKEMVSDINPLIFKYYSYATKFPNAKNTTVYLLAYMLDSSENVWGSLEVKNAEYIIAGPTEELFVASYNSVYHENLSEEYQKLYYNFYEDKGYRLSFDGINFNDTIKGELDTNGFDNLYIVTDTTKANAYVMIGPTGGSRSAGMGAMFDISIVPSLYDKSKLGFRPVVCLKKGTELIEQDNGTFIIE